MALRLGALQDAVLDAGASAEKAQKAAEELAGYEGRIAGIETKLAVLIGTVTTNAALSVAILLKLYH